MYSIVENNLFKAFHHCYISKPNNVDVLELVKLYELVSVCTSVYVAVYLNIVWSENI